MAQWKKLLEAMVADKRPVSYTYDQAATVLSQLGFTEANPTATSHRKWSCEVSDPASPTGKRTVTIGLNAKGKRALPPGYIRKMVQTLQENSLLPDGVQSV
jgi:hypothetical protein